MLLQDPECRARHEPFQTNIALAIDLVEEAIGSKVSCGVVGFDAWDLAADLIQVLARRRQDWISLLTKNRRLETARFSAAQRQRLGHEAARPPHRGRGARTS